MDISASNFQQLIIRAVLKHHKFYLILASLLCCCGLAIPPFDTCAWTTSIVADHTVIDLTLSWSAAYLTGEYIYFFNNLATPIYPFSNLAYDQQCGGSIINPSSSMQQCYSQDQNLAAPGNFNGGKLQFTANGPGSSSTITISFINYNTPSPYIVPGDIPITLYDSSDNALAYCLIQGYQLFGVQPMQVAYMVSADLTTQVGNTGQSQTLIMTYNSSGFPQSGSGVLSIQFPEYFTGASAGGSYYYDAPTMNVVWTAASSVPFTGQFDTSTRKLNCSFTGLSSSFLGTESRVLFIGHFNNPVTPFALGTFTVSVYDTSWVQALLNSNAYLQSTTSPYYFSSVIAPTNIMQQSSTLNGSTINIVFSWTNDFLVAGLNNPCNFQIVFPSYADLTSATVAGTQQLQGLSGSFANSYTYNGVGCTVNQGPINTGATMTLTFTGAVLPSAIPGSQDVFYVTFYQTYSGMDYNICVYSGNVLLVTQEYMNAGNYNGGLTCSQGMCIEFWFTTQFALSSTGNITFVFNADVPVAGIGYCDIDGGGVSCSSPSNTIVYTGFGGLNPGTYTANMCYIFAPRSTRPVYMSIFTSADGLTITDQTSPTELSVLSTSPNSLSVTLSLSDYTNGATSSLIIMVDAPVQLKTGDQVECMLTGVTLSASVVCQAVLNLDSVTCTNSGTILYATLYVSGTTTNASVSFSISQVTNYYSSAVVTNALNFGTYDNGIVYQMSQSPDYSMPLQTAAQITQMSLSQSATKVNITGTYNISFTNINQLLLGDIITVAIPPIFGIITAFSVATIYVNGQFADSTLYFNTSSLNYYDSTYTVPLIQFNLLEAVPAGSSITIELYPMTPTYKVSIPYVGGNYGFMIQTYDSSYNSIDDSGMALPASFPYVIACVAPCQTCSLDDMNYCLSCLVSSGYTILQSGRCTSACNDGYFLAQASNQCEACSYKCAFCSYNATYCLSCKQSGIYDLFYNNSCYVKCPDGTYVLDNALCLPCLYPCVTCTSPIQCLTCVSGYSTQVNGTNVCLQCKPGQFLYLAQCVSICPPGFSGDVVTQICTENNKNTTTGHLGNSTLDETARGPLTAKIESISTAGLLTLLFNQNILKMPNAQNISSSDLKVTMLLPSKIKQNILYQVEQVLSNQILLQLNFSNPTQVSTQQVKDFISVTFLNTQLFISSASMKTISNNFQTNYYSVPPQASSNNSLQFNLMKLASGIGTTGKAIVISNIAAQLFTMQSMSLLYGVVNSNQMIAFLPLFSFDYSYIVNGYLGIIRQFSTFQLFNLDGIFMKYGNLANDNPYNEYFEHEGFESEDLLLNADSTLGMLLISLGPLVFTIIVSIMKTQIPALNKVYDYLKPKLLYNFYIRTLMEANLELFIFSLLGVTNIITYSYGAIFATTLSIIFVMAYPLALLIPVKLNANISVLKSVESKQAYGTLCSEYSIKPAGLYHLNLVIFRRVTFGVCAIFLQDNIVLALDIITMLSIVNLMYILQFSPYETRFVNNQNLVNEAAGLLVFYVSFLFTDYTWGATLTTINNIGYALVIVQLFIMLINFVIIIAHLLVQVYRTLARVYNSYKSQAIRIARITQSEHHLNKSGAPLNSDLWPTTSIPSINYARQLLQMPIDEQKRFRQKQNSQKNNKNQRTMKNKSPGKDQNKKHSPSSNTNHQVTMQDVSSELGQDQMIAKFDENFEYVSKPWEQNSQKIKIPKTKHASPHSQQQKQQKEQKAQHSIPKSKSFKYKKKPVLTSKQVSQLQSPISQVTASQNDIITKYFDQQEDASAKTSERDIVSEFLEGGRWQRF